jgi:hypothetical protein
MITQPAAQIRDVLDPVKAVRGDIFDHIGPDAFDYYLNLKDNILTQKNILKIVFGLAAWGDSSLVGPCRCFGIAIGSVLLVNLNRIA